MIISEVMKSAAQFADVRNSFSDEISKRIYDDLVFYRLTGKRAYIHDIVWNYCRQKNSAPGFCDLIERNKNEQKDKIVFFGAALFANDVYEYMAEFGIELHGICDNDVEKQKRGFRTGEYPIHAPKDYVLKNLDAKYVITAIDHFIKVGMKEELIGYGVPEENIVFALSYYGTQYFDRDLVRPMDGEVFVDCGSLDCMTCVHFRDWTGGNYSKIFSFEPDQDNYKNCEKNIQIHKIDKVEMLPYGVWDRREVLRFINAKGGSAISDIGESEIRTISIDEVLKGEKATFIKMDIEGAELKALMGAKETIKKWHPKLAISIYHKPEDLIEIPEYIKGLSTDYHFYLRHYSSAVFESVLYAI